MEFVFTPEDARTAAELIARNFIRHRYSVELEVPYTEDAPFRPTMIARRKQVPALVVEAQYSLNIHRPMELLARWLGSEREYCEFVVAVDEEGSLPAKELASCMRLGIGVLLVSRRGDVKEVVKARNPALIVTPDPNLKLGKLKEPVSELIRRFNEGDRKDALRDLCELLERETEVLLEKLVTKGYHTLTVQVVRRMDWSTQIDQIGAPKSYVSGKSPVLVSKDIADLHSIRGARNLVDHKVRTMKEDAERERQFPERMMLGTRMAALLATAQRAIK